MRNTISYEFYDRQMLINSRGRRRENMRGCEREEMVREYSRVGKSKIKEEM